MATDPSSSQSDELKGRKVRLSSMEEVKEFEQDLQDRETRRAIEQKEQELVLLEKEIALEHKRVRLDREKQALESDTKREQVELELYQKERELELEHERVELEQYGRDKRFRQLFSIVLTLGGAGLAIYGFSELGFFLLGAGLYEYVPAYVKEYLLGGGEQRR